MNVNNLSKNQLVSKIINQANSLNKKIKKFKDKGIAEHFEFIEGILNDGQVEFNDSGSITKSTTFYHSQNTLQLKKTLLALHRINNHDIYGTVRKYEGEINSRFEVLQDTVEKYLIGKNYDPEEVRKITRQNAFMGKLVVAFKDVKRSWESEQKIEEVYLDYVGDGISEEEKTRALNDIEASINKVRDITAREEALARFMKENK